jgi:hypothetical protein
MYEYYDYVGHKPTVPTDMSWFQRRNIARVFRVADIPE